MKHKKGTLYLSFTKINTDKQSGFTLIELMVVLIIVGVLASIAVPSYRNYMKKNDHAVIESDLLRLSSELEQWQSKRLTYVNFTPKNPSCAADGGTVPSRCYTTLSSTKNIITSPIGDENAKYNIDIKTAIINGSSTTFQVIKSPDASDDESEEAPAATTIANNWIMIATPVDEESDLNSYAVTSTGVKCKTPVEIASGSAQETVWTTRKCGIMSEVW